MIITQKHVHSVLFPLIQIIVLDRLKKYTYVVYWSLHWKALQVGQSNNGNIMKSIIILPGMVQKEVSPMLVIKGVEKKQ